VTGRDLSSSSRLPFATRDEQGRLRVGAAIGATGDYLERAAELIKAGVDVLSSTSRTATRRDGSRDRRGAQALRRRRADRRQRRHGEGTKFLVDRGVDGIKVGSGPAAAAHTHDHELRRAAGAGARRLPPGGERQPACR
jgi:IMP dehydrogenase